MTFRPLAGASFVLVALSACVFTPPAPPPPQQTIVAQAPANVPGVPGVPTGSTGKPTLATTAANVTMTLGAERVMNDVLRDQDGKAPTGGILWLSSDDKVATVNPLSGQVRAVAPGTALLTASLQSAPSVSTQVTVTVTATGKTVQIRIEPANPELAIGERVSLVAKVQLADGTTSANVDWTSSDNTVAVVNRTTGEVSALKEGKVTIKGAYTQDGSQFGVSSVTVVRAHAASPAPTPEPTATPAPVATGTATPSPTATPTATPTPSPSVIPQQAAVEIRDSAFAPASVTVRVGGQVFFANRDTTMHSVVSVSGPAFSGTKDVPPGETKGFTFPTAGTVSYKCGYHASMTGTINVLP